MCAGEILRFADEIGEVRARFAPRVHISAVDLEGQHFHDPSACPIARRRTARCTCWSIGSLKPRVLMVLRTNSRLMTAAAPLAWVKSPSASVSTIGLAPVAPMTARQTERAESRTNAPIAWANSPVFRHAL